jgi:hypothetical protein
VEDGVDAVLVFGADEPGGHRRRSAGGRVRGEG